jgi:hypothetical protein
MKKGSLIGEMDSLRKGEEQKKYVKMISILCIFPILLLILSINVGMAEERYRGKLIVDKGGKYEIDNKDYVELVLDKDIVISIRLHTKAAHKDVKFSDCRKLEDDGSNFTKWYSIECRNIESYDGKSAAWLEIYFADAYVGISPEITPQYSMYKKLKEVSDRLGLNVPSRTFVIYADKKPIFEFFCYPENIKNVQK